MKRALLLKAISAGTFTTECIEAESFQLKEILKILNYEKDKYNLNGYDQESKYLVVETLGKYLFNDIDNVEECFEFLIKKGISTDIIFGLKIIVQNNKLNDFNVLLEYLKKTKDKVKSNFLLE